MKIENCKLKMAAGALAGLALLAIAATQVTPGKKTSEYPHITTLGDSDLLLVAVTNLAVPTNKNISGLEVLQQATNGLAASISNASAAFTINYVTNTSNSLITTISNATNTVVTSSVRVATNQTMMVLQTFPNAGSQWYVGTNGTPTTNEARSGLEFNAFWRSLRMGEVAGGADIYGLVGNGSNNWNNTNLGPLTVGHGSNAFVKGAYSSVSGGGNNAILSNANYSVIGGGYNNLVDTNANTATIGGGGKNSIRTQNTGNPASVNHAGATIAGGTNNLIGGSGGYSINIATIGGGGDNLVEAQGGTISGGFGNLMNEACAYSTIGGGINNVLTVDGGTPGNASVIGGGQQNSIRGGTANVIGGGLENNLIATGDAYCVIGGGQQNSIGTATTFPATHVTIGGGHLNSAADDTSYSVIGGGRENTIAGNSTNGVISGGAFNSIAANTVFATISGGERNQVTASYSGSIGGASNSVTAARAWAIGTSVTNGTADSVVAGEFRSYNTPSVIAGAGSGSTNYTLQMTTPEMVLGSSNVNIVAAMGWIDGKTHKWSVSITNLSGDNWGFSFQQTSNRVKWQSWMYGTNAPSVLTNNTVLRISGTSTGTNTLAEFKYFSPAL